MSMIESWIMLSLGIVLMFVGLIGGMSVVKSRTQIRGGIFFVLLVVIASVVLVSTSVIHLTTDVESISESLNDGESKIIRVYHNTALYFEVKDVTHVDTADADVITFTTADGLHHAIRPGSDMVVVTEGK